MRGRIIGVLAACAAIAQGGEAIFNGGNLDGWSGDPRLWRVEDGVIVGETDDAGRRIDANTFLVWEGEVGDFSLSYKAKVTGNNSGVQYRSHGIAGGDWRLGGYQMDLHPNPSYLGMLYEEGGRGIACERGKKVALVAGMEPKETGTLPVEEVDLAQWNEYRIEAQGHRLKHFVNGKLAAQITDLDPARRAMSGLIGLQLHAGPSMRAEFKDLQLERLPAEEICWIWSGPKAGPDEEACFRRGFEVPADLASAELVVSGDNLYQLWINGADLGIGGDWFTPSVRDVMPFLRPGTRNAIAVKVGNRGGAAGLAAWLTMTGKDGTKHELWTDGTWRTGDGTEFTWNGPEFDDSGWKPATVLARMGEAPWGKVIHRGTEAGLPRDVSDACSLAPGFRLEKVYEVPSRDGSWVAMTVDDEGRFYCSDQYGGLYRVTPDPRSVEKLPRTIGGAHGLLWFKGSLYVSVNEASAGRPGIYRMDDADGDGLPETIVLLKRLTGSGEHGAHGLAAAPDGEWIYFVGGNETDLPEMDRSLVPRVWDEDQLLPRRPDPFGVSASRKAPGGWIARFKPDGSDWELVAIGLRNAYRLAFNDRGDLFTYDADMEWDMGMPWYRPTRICQVVPGAEFGWRNGTGKWPEYYEDSMPPVLNIGPGSPTGLVSGKGARFPEKYQRAVFALDWTYATIHAVHLKPDGAGYTAEREEVMAGKGMPLTDAVIGKDGALYFLTGGRRTASALWRLSYAGEESTAPVSYAAKPLEPVELAGAATRLGSDDRVARFTGRVALEGMEFTDWTMSDDPGGDSWSVIEATILAARLHGAEEKPGVLAALCRLEWAALDKPRKLAWLRAVGLAFLRGGEPTPEERKAVLDKVDAAFPADDDEINAELCRLLCYLRAPGIVGRTLALMDAAPPPVTPDWLELAARNPNYGRAIESMIAHMPPTQVVHYVYCLRTVAGPWRRDERERFFAWLDRLETKSGGSSYKGFLADLRRETLRNATREERQRLDQRASVPPADPFAGLPPVEGPGRSWTVDEVAKLAEGGFDGADRGHGKLMFRAAMCAACHSVGGEGGAAGPDLSTLAGRFTAKDFAEAVIEPSKVVSDQYAFEMFSQKDGSQTVGRLIEEKEASWVVATNPFDFTRTVEIPRDEVTGRKPSPVSPMPGGLINRLNETELRDLMAYLLGK